MSDIFPAVPPIKPGEPVHAPSFNPSITALAARTDYLRRQVESLLLADGGGVLTLDNVLLHDEAAIGDMMYFDSSTSLYDRALAVVDGDGIPLASARLAGMLVSRSGTSGAIAFLGRVVLPGDSVAAGGEVLSAGNWYLSSLEPGKVTKVPQAPAVSVGTIYSDGSTYYLQLRPANLDGSSHHHISAIVYPAPAGTVMDTGGFSSVIGYHPDTVSEGIETLARLSIVDAGASSAIYTFVLTGDGTLAGTVLTWTTSNGSDQGAESISGVSLPGFEIPFSIGDNGIIVMLHRGAASGLVLTYADGSDYENVYPGAAAASDRTYTLQLPEQGKGWISTMSRTDFALADTDRRAVIFGHSTWGTTYGSPLAFTLNSVGGDITTGLVIDVTEPDGTIVNVTAILGQVHTLNSGMYIAILPNLGSDTIAAALVDTLVQVRDDAPDAELVYSTAQDPELARVAMGPQQRVELNGITQSRREQYTSGSGTYEVLTSGLYWYTNEGNAIPWSPDYVDPDNLAGASSRRDMAAYAAHPTVGSGVVTSLKTKDGSPLTLVNAQTGSPGTTGDLLLDLALQFSTGIGSDSQYKVVKDISGNGELLLGAVVSQVVAGAGITVTNLTPGAPAGQGKLRIDNAAGTQSGLYASTNLKGAAWARIPNQDFYYVQLAPYHTGNIALNTGVNVQFRLPTELTGKYKVAFYGTVFGLTSVPAAVEFAGINAKYTILPDLRLEGDPAVDAVVNRNLLQAGAAGFLSDNINTRITLGESVAGYTAGDAILIHNDPNQGPLDGQVNAAFSEPFPFDGSGDTDVVTAGDTVSITLTRAITTGAEYEGTLGILDMYWKLIEVL